MSQRRQRRKKRERRPSLRVGGIRGRLGSRAVPRTGPVGFTGDPTGLIIPVEFELHIDEGLEEVSDEAIDQIQQQARIILEEAGRDMENTARDLAPVKSGVLRDSIESEVYDVEGMAMVARTPYAAYVEYGTSKMEAQPFLEPAIEEHQPMLQEALDQMILEQVDQDMAEREEQLAEREEWLELEGEVTRE